MKRLILAVFAAITATTFSYAAATSARSDAYMFINKNISSPTVDGTVQPYNESAGQVVSKGAQKKLRVGIWSDLHYGAVISGQPDAGTNSLNLSATDITNNVPIDLLISGGDNTDGSKAFWLGFKTFLESNFRSKGVTTLIGEGNHDAQVYGQTVERNIPGYASAWTRWFTKYPYKATTLTQSVFTNATTARVATFTNMTTSEPLFLWNEGTQTGEAKRIKSVVGSVVHFTTALASDFDMITTVFQGRDRAFLYSNLRDQYGAGDSDLGEYGTSRVAEYGNNVFITLNMETFYDNPNFSAYQMHTSDTALDWLESKLKKYAGKNIFVVHHPIIDGSGLQTTWSIANPVLYLDGSSARIRTICQAYPIRAWFTGHAHFSLATSQGDSNLVRVNTPSGFGGTTFIGIPSTGRVAHNIPYATDRVWWYYIELNEGANSVTMRIRNSTDAQWENYDTVIPLNNPVHLR